MLMEMGCHSVYKEAESTLTLYFFQMPLTDLTKHTGHLSYSYLETRERVIGKHCRPRSDATSCGI